MADEDEHDDDDTGLLKKRRYSRPCEKAGDAFLRAIEDFFERVGRLSASHPWKIVLISIVLGILSAVTARRLYFKKVGYLNTWVPKDSQIRDEYELAVATFNLTYRIESYIIKSDNVLSKDMVQLIYEMDKSIRKLNSDNLTYEKGCVRLGGQCKYTGLLEVFNLDDQKAVALTDEEVVSTVNGPSNSRITNQPFIPDNVLGDITRDSKGNIIDAKATIMQYFMIGPGSQDGVVEGLTPELLQWEQEFKEIGENATSPQLKDIRIITGRTFQDEARASVLKEASKLVFGYCLVLVYCMIFLGRLNKLESRAYIAIIGLICVALGILLACAFAFALRFFWGTLHLLIPFLLLGIGVDDMFVICSAWDELGTKYSDRPIPERMGVAMKHAGSSILVTSLTNALAFACGAITVFPLLQSFCVFCAFGVIGIFFFDCLLFVAVFSLDERRKESNRVACCCCCKLNDSYEPSDISQSSPIAQFFATYYAPMMIKTQAKVIVLVLTTGLLAAGIYFVAQLRATNDDLTYYDPSGDQYQYMLAKRAYFPNNGFEVQVKLIELEDKQFDYLKNAKMLEDLYNRFANNKYSVPGSADAWFITYKKYLETIPEYDNTEASYYKHLQGFLNTTEGIVYQQNIIFNAAKDRITASDFTLSQVEIASNKERIKAMENMGEVCQDVGLTKDIVNCFPFAFGEYLFNDISRVILPGLIENIVVALVAIFAATLVLLSDLWSCLLVFLAVGQSVICVCGFMHAWGLDVDMLTSLLLLISMGLTVDYAAHIAHTFMTEVGSRNGRINSTLRDIGTAVVHGATSTFLAFILLASSQTYLFKAFFRILLLIITFGLWHCVVYLPVLLSLIGPPPFNSALLEFRAGRKTRAQSNLQDISLFLQKKTGRQSMYAAKESDQDWDLEDNNVVENGHETDPQYYDNTMQSTHEDDNRFAEDQGDAKQDVDKPPDLVDSQAEEGQQAAM